MDKSACDTAYLPLAGLLVMMDVTILTQRYRSTYKEKAMSILQIPLFFVFVVFFLFSFFRDELFDFRFSFSLCPLLLFFSLSLDRRAFFLDLAGRFSSSKLTLSDPDSEEPDVSELSSDSDSLTDDAVLEDSSSSESLWLWLGWEWRCLRFLLLSALSLQCVVTAWLTCHIHMPVGPGIDYL